MKISKYIKDTRIKMKLTQEGFSKLLGVKRATLANYERGYIDPSVTVFITIMKLRKKLNMKII